MLLLLRWARAAAGDEGDCDDKEKDLFCMSLHTIACFCRMEGEWAWWISQRVGAMGEAKQQGALVSVLEGPS